MPTYIKILETLIKHVDEMSEMVAREDESPKGVYDILMNFDNGSLGEFASWQVVADLMELHVLSTEIDVDSWAWLTPEARYVWRIS